MVERTRIDSAPEPAAPADLSAVIGRHVRAFRTQQGLTLRALAARSGLSVGFLSQLERGLTSISLTTLRDLADDLGHPITAFFEDGPAAESPATAPAAAAAPATPAPPAAPLAAVPADATSPAASPGPYFTLTRGSGEHSSQFVSGLRTYRLLSQRAPGLTLEPMLVTIEPGGRRAGAEVHEGEEFAYVISGELTFIVDGTSHVLRQGDSLHLRSNIPHELNNEAEELAVVVSVVTPRLF
ncbi:helix-turn-helix domain-containing protein [Nocardioides nitrophenolicus]|uniref:helix-turn-helix domain-containing protein n=1 Tax=Nocardioides nitrophenolicus TaxID=60489 RepID=UPI00195E9DF8|nr:cupin domain-containing protein [Nocardioides nitrophenolicus]MBM7518526.1 quercetin dioxygenase-like cupin family protein/DNA-binding XRE family transcriptional regulator [Nocardioides nitrophenolicus]